MRFRAESGRAPLTRANPVDFSSLRLLMAGGAAVPRRETGRPAGPPRRPVATWWIPEHWAFVDQVPKTSVGKFDKKVLRAAHAAGELRALSAAPA